MNRTLRWGLLGAGAIINRWINGAKQVDDMEIVAVASRTLATAQEAANKHNIQHAMTYDQMVERNDIDVVYIAVPHVAHKELAIQAMEHGKSVLVEKPAAVNAAEWKAMTDCAKKNNVFLMEAMWTRFFPLWETLHSILNEKIIGDVRVINAGFSFSVPPSSERGRLLDPYQAGGALLDLGVYTLNFCDIVLNKVPESLTGYAAFELFDGKSKADVQNVIMAKYDGGELAILTQGLRTYIPDNGMIYGTKGWIHIPSFWKPTTLSVMVNNEKKEYQQAVPLRQPEYKDEGFQYEIIHVNQCVREGVLSSNVMTWEATRRILEQCDSLRSQWDYKYPFE